MDLKHTANKDTFLPHVRMAVFKIEKKSKFGRVSSEGNNDTVRREVNIFTPQA